MSHHSVRITHGIHTNAAGSDGSGYRDLWIGAAESWPARDRKRARDWLHGLRPLRDRAPGGVAVACQRLGGVIHAVIGGVDTDFATDEHGRGGLLVHALWAALDESAPAGDFGLSLLELRRYFEVLAGEAGSLENSRRLACYVERCREKDACPVKPPDPRAALRFGRPLCLAMLSLAEMERKPKEIPWPEEGDVAAQLTQSASLLPPRLRLSISWQYRVSQSSSPASTIRYVPPDHWRPPPDTGRAAEVLGRIESVLESGGGDRLAAVGSDWNVASWRQFEQEILQEMTV